MTRKALLTLLSLPLVLAACTPSKVLDGGAAEDLPPLDRPPTLNAVEQRVDRALPPILDEDNEELLRALLSPRVAERGPSDVFDAEAAARELGMERPARSEGCSEPGTPCILSEGTRGGAGAYQEVRYDSLGNLAYLSRLADPSGGDPEGSFEYALPTYTGEERATIERLVQVFTRTFGVPAIEMAPVETWTVEPLAVGYAPLAATGEEEAGEGSFREGTDTVVVVAGVVDVPRTLEVEGLERRVPVLGSQVLGVVDDAGIHRIQVDDWTRFMVPDLRAARARTRRALVTAIADELDESLARMPEGLDIEIAYAKAADFPELSYGAADEEDETTADKGIPADHRYVPVLVTTVVPFGVDDPSEEEQARATATTPFETVTPLFTMPEQRDLDTAP